MKFMQTKGMIFWTLQHENHFCCSGFLLNGLLFECDNPVLLFEWLLKKVNKHIARTRNVVQNLQIKQMEKVKQKKGRRNVNRENQLKPTKKENNVSDDRISNLEEQTEDKKD
jgi:hypothetical protein